MSISAEIFNRLAAKFAEMMPHLDERQRRLYLGAEDKDPQLVSALLALVEQGEPGDPESPLWWTTKSLRGLAAELTYYKGRPCGKDTVRRLLREQGFSIHASAKTMEEKRSPDAQ